MLDTWDKMGLDELTGRVRAGLEVLWACRMLNRPATDLEYTVRRQLHALINKRTCVRIMQQAR
jgi:hypothetical protein